MPSFAAPRRRATLALLAAAATALLSPMAQANDNKGTITWLVGFPPGGTADVLTRSVAQQLGRLSGQNVVVDNRPGASGAIALQQAAKATPDGNTLTPSRAHCCTPTPYQKLARSCAPWHCSRRGPWSWSRQPPMRQPILRPWSRP